MGKNIYVGNLSFDTTVEDLQQLFAQHGEVASARVIVDKFSGGSRGFGFVEMPTRTEAQTAITGLSGKEMKGRPLNVSEARPRADRGGGSGGRQGGGYGGGKRRSW